MEDVLDMAKEVLGIGPFDPLSEENALLTPEQEARFQQVIDKELVSGN